MPSYSATVAWHRNGAGFTDNRYSRSHQWTFDGGITVPASASAHIVPAPLSDPSAVDPEEAFVASISSCHMLWFLSIAARQGFIVESYTDNAEGILGNDSSGKMAIIHVHLNPEVIWSGEIVPSKDDVAGLHRRAHEECFIANSVRTEITIHPV